MDIRCPKCNEPWDIDEIHDQVEYLIASGYPDEVSFDSVRSDFYQNGCSVLGGTCVEGGVNANPVLTLIYDMAGDDIDFAAGMIEDAEILGLLEAA